MRFFWNALAILLAAFLCHAILWAGTITPDLNINNTSTALVSSLATPGITVPANELVLINCNSLAAAATNTFTIATTSTGLTISSGVINMGGSLEGGQAQYYACTGPAVSGTFTCNWSKNEGMISVQTFQNTNCTNATPSNGIGASNTKVGATGTSITASLTTTATGSFVLGAGGDPSNQDTLTYGSGQINYALFTESTSGAFTNWVQGTQTFVSTSPAVIVLKATGVTNGTGGAGLTAIEILASSSPLVTTQVTTAITKTTATGNGTVVTNMGFSISDAGVCYATHALPTLADTCVSAGTPTGAYTASLTGLSAGTLYHLQAYATNTGGTSYGGDVPFVTKYVPGVFATPGKGSIKTSTGTGQVLVQRALGPTPVADAATTQTPGTTSISFSHTCTGSKLYIVVCIASGSNQTVSVAPTYAGTTLTLLGSVADSGYTAYAYGGIPTATGANNVVATLVGGASTSTAGAVCYSNVDQVGPVGPAVTAIDAGFVSVTSIVPSSAGNLVVDCALVDGTIATVGGSQTQLYNTGGPPVFGMSSTQPAATSTTMTWNFSGDFASQVAFPLNASR